MSSVFFEPLRIWLSEPVAAYRAAAGQTVIVSVDENPTTGYLWDLEPEPPDSVRILNTAFIPPGPGIGGGGERRWTLQIEKGPRIRLLAHLRHPWERDRSPERSASAEIAVL
jgi:predicted secreted protein